MGLRGWVSGSRAHEASVYPLGSLPTGFPPACPPCIPLGSPSCCSSLDKESLSTLCLAALERMKLSTATVAFTSPDSTVGHTGWAGDGTVTPTTPLTCYLQLWTPSFLNPGHYYWTSTSWERVGTGLAIWFFPSCPPLKQEGQGRLWFPERGTHQTWRQQ